MHKVVTFRCPVVLDQNVEVFAALSGRMKSEVIITAIREYLKRKRRVKS